MRLAKSFLLFSFLSKCKTVSIFPLLNSSLTLCGTFPLQNSLHPLTSLSLKLSPSFPLPSLRDGHLIHLTSWKDKYSLVESEAPASPLTQTGDEGKVSPLRAELRRPKCLNNVFNSSRHWHEDGYRESSSAPHAGFLFLFGEFDLSVQMTQFVRSCTKVLHDLRLKVFGGLEDCFIVKENKTWEADTSGDDQI